MRKNIFSVLLIAIAIILSYYTACFFGYIYDHLFPFELNSGWIGSSQSLQFVRGISLSLIFFITVFTYSWLFKKWTSMLWFISPLLLWEVVMDLRHIYIPILLIIIAFALAKLINLIISKFKQSNPPMIVK
jgi:hypothetical protein